MLAAHIPGVEAHMSDEDGHGTVLQYRIAEVHEWLVERFDRRSSRFVLSLDQDTKPKLVGHSFRNANRSLAVGGTRISLGDPDDRRRRGGRS